MLQQNTLLIELGSAQVKIGVAKYRGGVVHVQDAFLVDLPENIFLDGKILQEDIMRTLLFNALQERQIKAKEACLTLNGTNIITREISLPDVADHELADMLQYEIQQYMPIDLEQYVIEHKVLERFREDDHPKVRLMVVAISKQDVEQYYQFVKSLNVKPIHMDINGNALAKLFSPQIHVNSHEPIGNQTIAVIDMGSHSMTVNILQNGTLKMSRLVEWEGVDLDQLSEGKIVFDTMVNSLSSRIQRVFQYYASRGTASHVDCIYLYGGASNLDGLCEKLHEFFIMPVETISQLSNVQLSTQSNGIDLKRYLNTFGTIVKEK